MVSAIILAAGKATRFGKPKQFVGVKGKRILDYTVEIYKDFVDEYVVAIPPDMETTWDGLHPAVFGGSTRGDSIRYGVDYLVPREKVLIVDAVRCNTSCELVQCLITKLDDYDMVAPVMKSVNTVGYKIDNKFIPMSKEGMYDIQTPTAIRWKALDEVLRNMGSSGFSIFYEAYHLGMKIGTVPGDGDNIKITYPEDIRIFEALLEGKSVSNTLCAGSRRDSGKHYIEPVS